MARSGTLRCLRPASWQLGTAADRVDGLLKLMSLNANEGSPVQIATLKTINSATSFTVVTKSTDGVNCVPAGGVASCTSNGKLTNPIIFSTSLNSSGQPVSNSDCINLNVAHGQAWYNLAIAVDPTNNNNAIQGTLSVTVVGTP